MFNSQLYTHQIKPIVTQLFQSSLLAQDSGLCWSKEEESIGTAQLWQELNSQKFTTGRVSQNLWIFHFQEYFGRPFKIQNYTSFKVCFSVSEGF